MSCLSIAGISTCLGLSVIIAILIVVIFVAAAILIGGTILIIRLSRSWTLKPVKKDPEPITENSEVSTEPIEVDSQKPNRMLVYGIITLLAVIAGSSLTYAIVQSTGG